MTKASNSILRIMLVGRPAFFGNIFVFSFYSILHFAFDQSSSTCLFFA